MRISLTLGSGGARGYAHIGVLQELVARGHEVVAVAGASIGALVGGAFAAGKLDQLTETALKLSKTNMWLMFRPTLGAPGLVKLDRVMGISGTYRNDHYFIGADYEHHASKGDHYALGGILYMPRRKHHLYAGVEMLDYDGQKNWYQGALGYTYYLSPRTYTWLEGQRWTQGKDKGYDIALGIRHNF